MRALEEPLRQLATNAGLEGSVVVQSVRSAKQGQGLNVDSGEVEDLVKAGIIDPTMVTRSALQNAASIGKNILTTEAIVGGCRTTRPRPPRSPSPPGCSSGALAFSGERRLDDPPGPDRDLLAKRAGDELNGRRQPLTIDAARQRQHGVP